MSRLMISRVAASSLVLLSGCASAVHAPSLAPRAIEQQARTDPTSPVTIAISPIDPALAQKLAALLASAEDGNAVFVKTDTATAAVISAGRRAASGSEAWVQGEQARSALEASRQKSASALAELDALVIAQAEAATSNPALGGRAEIEVAQTRVEAIVAHQTARIAELTR